MRIREFELSHSPQSLPIRFESLYATALGHQLCVIGRDEARQVRHLSLDSQGDVVASAGQLPLVEVTGIASCAENLVVTGVATGNRPEVLRVAPNGKMTWHGELPSGGQFQHWPRPVEVANVVLLLSITSRPIAALHLTELVGDDLGILRSLALTDDTDGIDVLGDPTTVLLARVHAEGQRLELARIAGDRMISRIEVEAARPGAPSLARVNDRIALAWVTEPGEPRLQWFDTKLEPVGGPEILAMPPRGVVTRVQLMATDSKLAVLLHSVDVVGDAEVVHQPDGALVRDEPRRMFPLYVAAYDDATHRLGPFSLVDADARVFVACWLRGKLAVIHRGRETLSSVFELQG